AHDKGIVHRDLKPDNVMLLADAEMPGRERVKILDFGVAKMTASSAPQSERHRTGTGVALGTPEYMAPEQCMGILGVNSKADVYSLGVILFEMVTDRLPFQAELIFDVMAMHVREAPPDVRDT